MAFFLGLLVLAVLFFFREIIWKICLFLSKAKPCAHGPWSLRAEAHLRQPFKAFLSDSNFLETLFFTTWFGPRLLIARSFWDQLNESQQEVLFLWCSASVLRTGFLRRWIASFSIFATDRDIQLLGGNSLSFVDLLDLNVKFREKHAPSLLGQSLTAFSLIGPSLLHDWPSLEERKKSLARYLAQWAKAE